MLHITRAVEFPPRLKMLYQKAIRYEWISFVYMITAALFSFLVMGDSQTMKTVWLEDFLGIVPPASFLVASKIIYRRPNKDFAYGFHKAGGIAFLTSSLVLFFLGVYLLVDGSRVLIMREHPVLSNISIGGYSIWIGYLMILALLWSSVPSTILGHIKIPLANKLYDKILYTDSKMNKASWMSGFASIFGIIGIGLGYWWADATVAILISSSIISDGYKNLKQAVLDLIGEVPKTIDETKTDLLINEVKSLIKQESWIKSFKVRFRDEGHVFFGEIFIEPKENPLDVKKIDKLRKDIERYNWRLLDVVIMPFFKD
jgi:divalent metal cation (Fe/Co/Zn/Cd) transporter